MREFKTAPDFSTKSVNELGGSRNAKGGAVPSWSSRDLEQSMGTSSLKERSKNKQKRKKIKSATSSPSSSAKSSRSGKSKPSFAKSVSQAQASPSLHGILLQ
ncbi:hypothetical protein FRX31_028203 [Thalictrum thalictroides]|nr:hypothetical protein FRX31_028203 [Thalictrum thalictroides]